LRFNLTAKLTAWILCLALLPIAGVSVMSIKGIYDINGNANTLSQESLLASGRIAEGSNDLASVQELFTIYVAGEGSIAVQYALRDLGLHSESFDTFITDYDNDYRLFVMPGISSVINASDRGDLFDTDNETIDSIRTGWNAFVIDRDIAEDNVDLGLYDRAMNAAGNASIHLLSVSNNLDTLISTNQEAAALMDQVVSDSINSAIITIVASAAATAVAIFAVTLVISRNITKPVVAVSRTAKTISGGNYRTKLDMKVTNDEIGDLVKSMNLLIDNTSQPMVELTECAKAIAAGDLSKEIKVTGSGDLAVLVESFKKMRANLAKLNEQIRTASESLKDSSSSLAETIGHMTQSTQQVSSSVGQASKSAQIESAKIDEMVKMLAEQTKAIYDVVQSAQNAASASANASEVAQNGSKSAQHSLERMNSLLKNVEGTSDSMRLLSKKSKEISQIVAIITNIAQQTNLLSLNAAIEAARAGEQGRGFAVVADEVRKLAEGSRKAAGQIQQLIELVEHDIEETTQKMDRTMTDASESSRTISDSLKSLEDIAATVEETAAMVEEISASTEEQKALTESLARSLDEVATIARENSSAAEGVTVSSENLAAGMEELTASAHELAELANQLTEMTRQAIGSNNGSGQA
jgi:methyl-accepting chemotaxis protein